MSENLTDEKTYVTLHEKLGSVMATLDHLKEDVKHMKAHFPRWAIVGGFLSGLAIELSHHAMGCGAAPNVPPQVVIAVDTAACILDKYAGAYIECGGSTTCIVNKYEAIADGCGSDITNVIKLITQHRASEMKELYGYADAGDSSHE